MTDVESKAGGRGIQWVVVLATVAVLACLLVKMMGEEEVGGALLATLVVANGLLLVAARVSDLTKLTLNKDGLNAELRETKAMARAAIVTAENAERQSAERFRRVAATSLNDSEVQTLRTLSEGRMPPEPISVRLRTLGLIDSASGPAVRTLEAAEHNVGLSKDGQAVVDLLAG